MPIHNTDTPDWWLGYGIPVGTLIASFLAALFGGMALRYIGKQIEIANRQTAIATEALGATQDSVTLAKQDLDATLESLKATKQALEITLDQARKADAERNKRPELIASLDHEAVEVRIGAARRETIYAYVENIGSRSAQDCVLRMYFPRDFRDPDEVEREEHEEQERRRRANAPPWGYVPDLSGIALRPIVARHVRDESLGELIRVQGFAEPVYAIARAAGDQLVPSVPFNIFFVDVWAPQGKHAVFWSIESEGAKFPRDESFGSIQVIAT